MDVEQKASTINSVSLGIRYKSVYNTRGKAEEVVVVVAAVHRCYMLKGNRLIWVEKGPVKFPSFVQFTDKLQNVTLFNSTEIKKLNAFFLFHQNNRERTGISITKNERVQP